MRKIAVFSIAAFLLLAVQNVFARNPATVNGFTDAADFGFLPTETGVNNTRALQAAVDKGGTIVISKAGIYKLAGTVYIGDSTSLVFGNGTVVQKSNEQGVYTHVFINKGALARTYNYHISITGLTLSVNDVEKWMDEIYGLRGQIAFFYIKDLKIDNFRCTDLGKGQFCIHICTFEDLLINDIVVKGHKDGIHLGRGSRFKLSNCVFQTYDDAIALAAGGWVTGNPEMGLIEDGIIENCYDLNNNVIAGSAFAKIGAGGWLDWKEGMDVMQGDAVVTGGKIYRVITNYETKKFKSLTRPDFEKGTKVIDGITWLMYQKDTIHSAVCKNLVFRDIYCKNARIPFLLICYDVDMYCHSYRRGAPLPVQSNITLENIHVQNSEQKALVIITSPADFFTVKNSLLNKSTISFVHTSDFDVYPETHVSLVNCTFASQGKTPIVTNNSPKKLVYLKTMGSIELAKDFSATVEQGPGTVLVESDLTGLKK